MRVLTLYRAVSLMHYELRALVTADFATVRDGVGLRVEVLARACGAPFFEVPATVWIWNDVMRFPWHGAAYLMLFEGKD